MMISRTIAIVVAASGLLSACGHSVVRIDSGMARANSVGAGTHISGAGIRASTDSRLGAAIIIAVLLADGLRYFRQEPDGTRTPVDAASAWHLGVTRQVSVQDCTQPVDLTAGNLVCR